MPSGSILPSSLIKLSFDSVDSGIFINAFLIFSLAFFIYFIIIFIFYIGLFTFIVHHGLSSTPCYIYSELHHLHALKYLTIFWKEQGTTWPILLSSNYVMTRNILDIDAQLGISLPPSLTSLEFSLFRNADNLKNK